MQQLITCSSCKSDRVITDHESGEIICDNCGTIISDNTQEKQAYGFSTTSAIFTKRHNTGPRTSLARHDKGLSTIIGRQNRDASGHKLDAAMCRRMGRLRTWDLRIKANDRNLIDALNILHTSKDKLGIPDTVVEKTAYIYRKVQKKGLIRGRTKSAVLAAATYVACRDAGIPKTLKEIAKANNIKPKELAKCYRILIRKLDINIPTVDRAKYIIKVANKVNVSVKTIRTAMAIMHLLIKNEISAGKDPMGFAGIVLYIACLITDEKRTQADIAKAAGITGVTLRNRYRDIKSRELDLIPVSN